MVPVPHSRGDFSNAAATIATTASVGTTSARPADAPGAAAHARARIDDVLRRAVDAGEVPGVVAMAATDKGVLYISAGILRTENPELSNDVDFFPGAQIRWGLAYMLNLQPSPHGRSAGTVSWGGLFDTYYWLDPSSRVTGLIMTQIVPFADERAVKLYGRFERGVYEALTTV